ncbi:MAG TPA: polymorphic toxin-type HINT domain-containing protein [Pirellulales bacterium]|jgi:tetratricopeptide (TPR) repeat protein
MRATQGQACAAGRFFSKSLSSKLLLSELRAIRFERRPLLGLRTGFLKPSLAFRAGMGLLLAASVAFFVSYPRAHAAEQQTDSSEAAQFVRQALTAEATGDATGRTHYLAKALAADPDYAPAHWQLGEVRQNGTWIGAEELPRDRYFGERLKEYRRKIDGTRHSLGDQLILARYCRNAGLQDQERLHYSVALLINPELKEARDHLQLVDFHGTQVLPAQATMLEAREHMLDVTVHHWMPRIDELCKSINGDELAARSSGFEALSTIRDREAIPALEGASRNNTGTVGRAVVASLSGMRGQEATDSLVRHAVLAQDDAVRQAAIDGLRPRSLYASVPMLLNYLQLPVEVRFDTFFLADHRPAHRLTMFQEGQSRDMKFVSQGATKRDVSITGKTGAMRVNNTPDPTLGRDLGLAQAAQQFNGTQVEVNARTAVALRNTTGEDLSDDPKAWWEWWASHNEMYRPTERPVSYLQQSSITPVQIRYHSCFVAGTTVWTIAGQVPIERIKVGEFVLAQNVETGELTYKPVLATTVGPKIRDLVEITAGGETIRATYGHLFWVSGVGWKMAKELEPGELLHTTHGPVVIDNIEKQGMAVCHNLIVAEFNTYFVTDQAFLVHDINVRGPTMATVPGLIDEAEDVVSTSP